MVTKEMASHLSCCQGSKVVNCFGNGFPKQSDDNPSNVFITNSNVEENLLKIHLKRQLIKSFYTCFCLFFQKMIFLMDFHPSTFFCRHDGSTPSRVTQRSLSQATTAMIFSRTQTDSMSSVRPEKEASKCFNICIILGKCSGSTLNLTFPAPQFHYSPEDWIQNSSCVWR